MSATCELSGVKVLYGNKVSHSQRKTRRRFEPNLHTISFASDLLKEVFSLRVNMHTLRSVDKIGGFDAYMMKVSSDTLSCKAKTIKSKILKRVKENA